jgi:hypothetical protein
MTDFSSVEIDHPIVSDGQPTRLTCTVEIHIRPDASDVFPLLPAGVVFNFDNPNMVKATANSSHGVKPDLVHNPRRSNIVSSIVIEESMFSLHSPRTKPENTKDQNKSLYQNGS